MSARKKQQLRALWFKIHKWLGLALALPVILIFLSGSLLVWKASVDDLLHPQRKVGAAAVRPLSFYVTAAERALAPDERLADLTYPATPGAVVVVAAGPGGSGMAGRIRYFLDPATGRVLDRASENAGPLRLVHILHGSLLLGRPGGRLVGAIAFALLLSALSGLWLWWPVKGSIFRAMRWGRTQSTNANLHHQAGYWFAVPLVVLSLTGATISFSGLFNTMVGDQAAVRGEAMRATAAPLALPHLQPSAALAAAGSPRNLLSIKWPTTLEPRWIVSFRTPGGTTLAAIDDGDGKASRQSLPPESTANLMRRVHDGTGTPRLWQIVIFISGLLGATMAVTGVIMWLKGQIREVRMRDRRAAR